MDLNDEDVNVLKVVVAWHFRVISDRDAVDTIRALHPDARCPANAKELRALHDRAVAAGYRLARDATAPTGTGLHDGILRVVKGRRQLPKVRSGHGLRH